MKVCHLTSVHPRSDVRIFVKECASLANNGYSVSAVVADGLGDETLLGIKIYDVGSPKNRIERMIRTVRKVLSKGLDLNADVYHFHDPELLTIARTLQRKGKYVIYDIHEDVQKHILSKTWIPRPLRKVISFLYRWYERRICGKLNALVTVTPYITDKYRNYNKNVHMVRNFPLLTEFEANVTSRKESDKVIYIGAIHEVRGIWEMLDALDHYEFKLIIGGRFASESLKEHVFQHRNWPKVQYLGFLDRNQVIKLNQDAAVGLSIFRPVENYINGLPVKIFEYMASGIPQVASDFPLFKSLIEEPKAGICVDPLSPREIAEAIKYLVNHKEEAKTLGENGRKIVMESFNWNQEEISLLNLYKSALN